MNVRAEYLITLDELKNVLTELILCSILPTICVLQYQTFVSTELCVREYVLAPLHKYVRNFLIYLNI